MMINDVYVNQVSEKSVSVFFLNDKNKEEATTKFSDFLARSKESESKKQIKIKQKAEDAESELSRICTGVPTTSNKKNEYIRTAEEYYEDQLQAIENKNYKVELLRQQVLASEPIQDKPEINEVYLTFLNNRIHANLLRRS